jgi:hypothetical protein
MRITAKLENSPMIEVHVELEAVALKVACDVLSTSQQGILNVQVVEAKSFEKCDSTHDEFGSLGSTSADDGDIFNVCARMPFAVGFAQTISPWKQSIKVQQHVLFFKKKVKRFINLSLLVIL